VRVGVIGVGHLGGHHAKILRTLPDVELTGLHDEITDRARQLAQELGVRAFDSASELLSSVDAVTIAVPATRHLAVSQLCFDQKKHVFLEKPIASSLAEADRIVDASRKQGVLLQVGHIERFNPAVRLAGDFIRSPRFIEGHRLGPYAGRGTDVDVVLDLMIHDIDLINHFVQDSVTTVDAVGVPVLSATGDIANARLEFRNGCIANLTSSRVSQKQVRKLRFFQRDSYVSVDCKAKEVDVVRRITESAESMPGNPTDVVEIRGEGGVHIQKGTYRCEEGNSLRDELTDFVTCILTNRKPLVGGAEARDCLRVALAIDDTVRKRSSGEMEFSNRGRGR
jgi:predicted dehydrogenase